MSAPELAQQLKARFAGLIGDPVEFRDEVSAIAFGVAHEPAANQITEAGESQ